MSHRRRSLESRRMKWTNNSRFDFQGTRQPVRRGAQRYHSCCSGSCPRRQVRNVLFVLCGATLLHNADNVERLGLTGANAYVLHAKRLAVKSRVRKPQNLNARQRRGLVHLDLRSGFSDKDTRDFKHHDPTANDAGHFDGTGDLGNAGNGSDDGVDDAKRRPRGQGAQPRAKTSMPERANRRGANPSSGITGSDSLNTTISSMAAILSVLVLLWLAGSFPALSGLPQTMAYAVLFFGLYWTISWRVGLTESENDGVDIEAASSFLDGGELLSAPARVALFCIPASVLSASLVATPLKTDTSNYPSGQTALCVVAAIALTLTLLDAAMSPAQSPTGTTPPAATGRTSQSQIEEEEEEIADTAIWKVERKLLDRWDADFRDRPAPAPPQTSFLSTEETDDV
jgi:hypothetical protein